MVLRNTTIVQRRLKFFEIRVEKSSAVDSFLEQREASVKKKKKKKWCHNKNDDLRSMSLL